MMTVGHEQTLCATNTDSHTNTYEAADVKRADGCIYGGGVAVRETNGESSCQVSAADLISVAGHSLGLHQTPIEGQCFRGAMFHGKQWHPQAPRPRNSSVPSCRSSQSSGLCPKTLLVSVRLGGGAATGHLVTHHQEDEQERQSNQTLGSGSCSPDIPSQSMLYIRKEHRSRLYPLSAS